MKSGLPVSPLNPFYLLRREISVEAATEWTRKWEKRSKLSGKPPPIVASLLAVSVVSSGFTLQTRRPVYTPSADRDSVKQFSP
jgi:hypothetical protein